jgi:lipoprotein-anchoring transpeptidase ErfK/SrfK
MKFKYQPYHEGPRATRQIRLILLGLAVVIVGLVALNRYRNYKPAPGLNEDVSATETVVTPAAVEQTPPATPTAAVAPVQTPQPVTQPTVVQAIPEPNQAIVVDNTSPEAAAVVKQAVEEIGAGRIITARDQLNRSLDMKLGDKVRGEVKTKLAELANQWLFGKTVCAGDTLTELHKVGPGEVLAILARQYKVPHECIEKINGITNPERLQAGQTIKIVHGPFSAVVSKKNFTLDLYLQGMFVKSYRVGMGRTEHETPLGKWRAAAGGKLVKPTWTDPDTGKTYYGNDPDYPLGSRWIALDGLEGAAKGRTGFAIHGTKDPETIGTQASRGCIRLFNGDVVEVYDLMEAGVSEVMVVE